MIYDQEARPEIHKEAGLLRAAALNLGFWGCAPTSSSMQAYGLQ